MRKVMLVAGFLMLGWPVAHMLLAQDRPSGEGSHFHGSGGALPISRNGSPT